MTARQPQCPSALGAPNGFLAQQSKAEETHCARMQLAQTLVGKTGKECREAGLTTVPEDWDTAVLTQVTWDSMLWTRPQPLMEIKTEAKLP